MQRERQKKKKSAHKRVVRTWAAFDSKREFWREMMGLSIIVFAVALGSAVLGWTFVTGGKMLISSVTGFSHVVREEERIRDSEAVSPVKIEYRRALDGMPLYASEEGEDYVAIIIDNFVTARPASGVAYAPLVIEAPVESGITRLLAVFHLDHGLDRIGPIRSARPYFVDWAREFDALLVHVGGSNAALAMLKEGESRDLNEFTAGTFFWRDHSRNAPHNAYTSGEHLEDARMRRFNEVSHRRIVSWNYKEDRLISERPEEATIILGYRPKEYEVQWKYDPESNTYFRFQGGKQVFDEDGTPVRAKNIIVQYTEIRTIDKVGRKFIRTVGKGKVLVARDGEVVEGFWEREPEGRLMVRDGENAIALNSGTTWIEVISNDARVSR